MTCFPVHFLCFGCMWCFISSFLVVSTSAIDCMERLVSKMTCYVSSGMLNSTHWLWPNLWCPRKTHRERTRERICYG